METKFTPGPWGLVDRSGSFELVSGEDEACLGTIYCDLPTFQVDGKANAALIAAAPELYALLVEAEDDLYSFGLNAGHALGSPSSARQAADLQRRCREVLAKARGEKVE